MPNKKDFLWLDRNLSNPGPYMTLVRSEKAYKKAFKHLKAPPTEPWVNENFNAMCHWLTKNGELCCIICIKKDENHSLLQIYAILVHEAVHAVDKYFEQIGENNPAFEQKAYAIQIVSQNLMYEYHRQINCKAKRKAKHGSR